MKLKQKSADGTMRIGESSENKYASEMTDRQQKEILERYFTNCLGFWRRQGKNEEDARNLALNELRQVKSNPFTPRIQHMNLDIVAMVVAQYGKEL